MSRIVKSTVAGALGLAAKALSAASSTLSAVSTLLGQEQEEQREARRPASTAEVIRQVESSDQADRIGRVQETPRTLRLDEEPHQRRSETHVEELASKTAEQVIAAVDELSTDELRLLIEHEQAHRNRKTVLQAVERALAPSSAGQGR